MAPVWDPIVHISSSDEVTYAKFCRLFMSNYLGVPQAIEVTEATEDASTGIMPDAALGKAKTRDIERGWTVATAVSMCIADLAQSHSGVSSLANLRRPDSFGE